MRKPEPAPSTRRTAAHFSPLFHAYSSHSMRIVALFNAINIGCQRSAPKAHDKLPVAVISRRFPLPSFAQSFFDSSTSESALCCSFFLPSRFYITSTYNFLLKCPSNATVDETCPAQKQFWSLAALVASERPLCNQSLTKTPMSRSKSSPATRMKSS